MWIVDAANHVIVSAMARVQVQVMHALEKHGPCTTDPCRGVAVLTEEVGEVAEMAVNATRKVTTDQDQKLYLAQMCEELDQVAAYAMMLRCSMESIIVELNREPK
jgi:NTP pyrophosphatase (non-canonical NTP hydrolase)